MVGSNETAPAAKPAQSLLSRIAFAAGAAGLLAAMAIDALAVLGRHTGLQLLGAIELVQTAIVFAGGAAMIVATLAGTHAAVHILTERVSPRANRTLAAIAHTLSAALFLALVAGSAWVASDLWSGFEQTELLHIPQRWLRLVAIACFAVVALLFLRATIDRKPHA